MKQWMARGWYLRVRRVFPHLPPWSVVRVCFARLDKELARIEYDTKKGRLTRVRIAISHDFRGSAKGKAKLAFREYAHELAHLVRPRLQHGPAFERLIIRIKVAMERDPAWY